MLVGHMRCFSISVQNMGTTLRSSTNIYRILKLQLAQCSFLYMDNMLFPFLKSEGFIDYFMNKIHFSRLDISPVNAFIRHGFSSSLSSTILTQKPELNEL